MGSVSQVFAWHPGACVVMMHAVIQKSCSGQEYWTSGDLEPSSALSTLVIVSLHGATPMRGDGVCVNGESLLFNTSSLSSSLSLSLSFKWEVLSREPAVMFLTVAAVSPLFSSPLFSLTHS